MMLFYYFNCQTRDVDEINFSSEEDKNIDTIKKDDDIDLNNINNLLDIIIIKERCLYFKR